MCTHLQATDVLLEAKASYFGFTDSYFRKTYGSGAGLYGMEVSARAWKNLFPWTSISFLYKEGSIKFFHPRNPLFVFYEPVNLLFVPLGIGFKYFFPVKMVDFYAGAGALVTFVQISSHNFWTLTQIGGGGIAKLGILFHHRQKLFLDLFGDYSWQFIPNSCLDKGKVFTSNLNGWSAGAGLGYKF